MKITQDEMHFVPKVWGFERWICNNEKYCGKLLHIDEGHASSYHFHAIKEEHMYVTSGKLEIAYGYGEESECERVIVEPGEAFHIPIGLKHRLIAHGGPVEFFEFSTQHLDRDSHRVTPGY